VGTLAAGVGHEINNPLADVIGNLDFALEELRAIAGMSPSGRLREIIEVLAEGREGADRIRKIVRGLRSLAREDIVLHAVDVQSTFETALSMSAHEVKHRATVRVSVEGAPFVHADESRLTQVLVNLVVNAAQAFATADPAANTILVTAGRCDGNRVSITVKDNGPGIPAASAQGLRPVLHDQACRAGHGAGVVGLAEPHRRTRRRADARALIGARGLLHDRAARQQLDDR